MPKNLFRKEAEGKFPAEDNEIYLNRHIIFRKKFTLSDIDDAKLLITADDYYRLYINGHFVTSGPAASYPCCYYYNEIDVSDYLTSGENTFAIHVYYQGLINRVWVSGDRRCMLRLELLVGGRTVLVSDESWRCHNHTAYTALHKIGYETAFTEIYDSRSPECDFYLPHFDDSRWESSAIYKNADYKLIPQPTKQLIYYKTEPKIIKKRDTGVYLDFGQEFVGYIYAEMRGNAGDTVTLHTGEELTDDGSVRYNLRCNCVYEDKWILSGGLDKLNQFDYKAFRYAEIILPEGAELIDVYMIVRHYPYARRASFSSLTPDEEKIVELCENTIKYCMQENFVDCATREKGQYLGDVTIAARSHAILTGDTSMMKKAILDFCRSSFICEGIMAVSTSSFMQEIADYSLQFPAHALWVYKTDGDLEFLRLVEPYMTGVLNYFKKYMGENGLISSLTEKWNLVDWPKNLRDGYVYRERQGDLHNVLNAFFCGFLDSMDELYKILGKEKTGLTEKAKTSFIQTFYSVPDGLFTDDTAHSHISLHSNILPLLFDIGTEDRALSERLISYIMERRLTASGVYMAYFALAALKRHGRMELCRELILDKGAWLNMIAEGGTTAFEAWGKDQKWNTSLAHPWATAPIIILADGAIPY